jgi:hypothetical protein
MDTPTTGTRAWAGQVIDTPTTKKSRRCFLYRNLVYNGGIPTSNPRPSVTISTRTRPFCGPWRQRRLAQKTQESTWTRRCAGLLIHEMNSVNSDLKKPGSPRRTGATGYRHFRKLPVCWASVIRKKNSLRPERTKRGYAPDACHALDGTDWKRESIVGQVGFAPSAGRANHAECAYGRRRDAMDAGPRTTHRARAYGTQVRTATASSRHVAQVGCHAL